jgi:hypothetical protein
LHALLVAAFFTHAAYAFASFFGFAAVGSEAPPMHVAAPLSEPQPWNASTVAWQSLFLPHAAAGFAHVLSMHLPQSLSLIAGAAGAGGGLLAAAAAVSAVDAAAALSPVELPPSPPLAAAGSDAPPSPLLADSSAGVSGCFEPPPQAAQIMGRAGMRRRLVTIERGRALMSA